MRGSAVLAVALATMAFAGPVRAQADTAAAAPADSSPAPRGVPAAVRWGKWASVGAAVGFTVLGLRRHNDADAAFGSLVAYCGGPATCNLAADGHYADPAAEALYQRAVQGDRAARAWLVAGQVTAVGSALLFVVDLVRPHEEPNIPYSRLLLESGRGVMRLGVRIPVRIGTGRR